MARRLAVLLTRNLATDTRKVFHRTFAAACYGGHRVPVVTRIPPISCQDYSTNVTESSQEVLVEPPGIFKRFWRWLLDSDDMDTDYKMSEEEREERDNLMVKVQEMYFANPPVDPNLDFYKEVIEILIKYSDRPGVETLWNLMPEMKVEPDEELRFMVTTFLEESRDQD